MTAARQERKLRHSCAILVAIGASLGGLGLVSGAIGAATSEMVVVNRYTGLAIEGFDPVAYFVDAAPSPGQASLELRADGAIWRFRNEGNRAAFAANPDVYMPRFGGHDPIAVARGTATDGNPALWLIDGARLYLFYSEDARTAFAADPDNAVAAAERNWPEVRRGLVP
jgi:hypothetical protein